MLIDGVFDTDGDGNASVDVLGVGVGVTDGVTLGVTLILCDTVIDGVGVGLGHAEPRAITPFASVV